MRFSVLAAKSSNPEKVPRGHSRVCGECPIDLYSGSHAARHDARPGLGDRLHQPAKPWACVRHRRPEALVGPQFLKTRREPICGGPSTRHSGDSWSGIRIRVRHPGTRGLDRPSHVADRFPDQRVILLHASLDGNTSTFTRCLSQKQKDHSARAAHPFDFSIRQIMLMSNQHDSRSRTRQLALRRNFLALRDVGRLRRSK